MQDTSKEMARAACHALSEKKAEDIKVIDIHEISVIADYFVIASAANSNQLQALIDEVEEELYKLGYTLDKLEGNRRSSWILMDYKDLIVHLFSREDRLFYDLERIWQDGTFIEPEDL
ncbi:MAG: ribosome silencing factor [Lachnospiraceae bacterium]|nr:ribosome silencing factor [Lachnospiraceae bacterium]